MDQIERKEKHLSLPPNYVSLAQLQERWLQKQREKEMSDKREKEMIEEKEKEMTEKQEDDSKKQQRDAGLNENQKQRGFLKNGWRDKKASIEEKGKGKEIVVDGFENKKNDYKNNNKKKKKKKRGNRKKKFEKGTEKLESETNKGFSGGRGFGGENGGNDGLKGPTEKIIDSRGGFSRNGNNRGTGDNSQRQDNNRTRFNQLKETEVNLAFEKMVARKGQNWTWIERRRNGNDHSGEGHYRSKENGQDASKDDVLGLKLEKKASIENLEIDGEISNLNGGHTNGLNSNDLNRVIREGLNNNGSISDKRVDGVVLPLESVGIGEKGVVGNGYRRYVNSGRRFRGGDRKTNVSDVRHWRFEGRLKMKEKEKSGMIWVKKADMPGAYVDARFGTSGISAEQAQLNRNRRFLDS